MATIPSTIDAVDAKASVGCAPGLCPRINHCPVPGGIQPPGGQPSGL